MTDVVFPGCLALAWAAAYLIWLRPWLKAYRRTAGIMARIAAGEARGLAWLRLRLRGVKTTALLFLTSVATGGLSLAETLAGLDPSGLAPFQDAAVWHALVSDDVAVKAASVATLVAAVLALRARLRDLRTVPLSDPAEAAR